MHLNWRMDKENIHLYDEVNVHLLKCLKKNDHMKFEGKWMELEKKIILSEVTQTKKDKHGVYSLIGGY